jgi:hypothetical protein
VVVCVDSYQRRTTIKDEAGLDPLWN